VANEIVSLALRQLAENTYCSSEHNQFIIHSPNTIGATIFVPLHLLLQNSLINWALLTGNGNIKIEDDGEVKKNNAQRHSPRPIRND
jgi:hypothetical protein